MQIEYIVEQVDRIVKRTGTRDPFEICRLLDYHIRYMNLQRKLKGYYIRQSRIVNIVIDDNVVDIFRPILVAHELGHSVLHKPDPNMLQSFQELEVLEKRKNNPTEYEANLFAAELLIEDQKVLDLLNEYTFFETASILNVPAALLDFKFYILHKKGYSLNTLQLAKSDFLKEDLGAYSGDNYHSC